jgi:hypothetical protein
MLLISFSTIFLLCGCSFLNAFRFHSHIKLATKPTQSGDMVSKFFTLDTKLLTRLFSNLPASVNGKDDSIRSLDSKIKKIEDKIANLQIELSYTTNEQERILIRQRIVEKEKQLTAVLSSTGELIHPNKIK